MKKLTLLLILFTGHLLFGQVGIGTTDPNPSSILDIHSTNSGVLFPQVALTSLTDASTITEGNVSSLIVYNTTSTAPLTPGYYYWSAAKWNRLMTETSVIDQATMPKFFYMPSIAMPTAAAHFVTGDGFTVVGGVFSISLYDRYATQFVTPKASNPSKTTTLPALPSTELDYYITSFDTAVFEDVTISDAGVLNYKIKTGAQVTTATFMNIVFAVK